MIIVLYLLQTVLVIHHVELSSSEDMNAVWVKQWHMIWGYARKAVDDLHKVKRVEYDVIEMFDVVRSWMEC
jgi:hypothetical protein